MRDVGREVQRRRELAGKTLAALAAETKIYGSPIHRVALGKLERGERDDVTLRELVGLAAALNTSPVALLFTGQLADGEVELGEGWAVTASGALEWFCGNRALAGGDELGNGPGLEASYTRNNEAVRLSRELDSLMLQTGALVRLLDGRGGRKSVDMEMFRETSTMLGAAAENTLTRMRAAGMIVAADAPDEPSQHELDDAAALLRRVDGDN